MEHRRRGRGGEVGVTNATTTSVSVCLCATVPDGGLAQNQDIFKAGLCGMNIQPAFVWVSAFRSLLLLVELLACVSLSPPISKPVTLVIVCLFCFTVSYISGEELFLCNLFREWIGGWGCPKDLDTYRYRRPGNHACANHLWRLRWRHKQRGYRAGEDRRNLRVTQAAAEGRPIRFPRGLSG